MFWCTVYVCMYVCKYIGLYVCTSFAVLPEICGISLKNIFFNFMTDLQNVTNLASADLYCSCCSVPTCSSNVN